MCSGTVEQDRWLEGGRGLKLAAHAAGADLLLAGKQSRPSHWDSTGEWAVSWCTV